MFYFLIIRLFLIKIKLISIKRLDSCFIDIQHLSIMFVATQLCVPKLLPF